MSPPLPVKAVDWPAHNVIAAAGVMETDGKEAIPMVTVEVFVQPLAFVPITVYVVAETGETTTDVPDKAPGFQT